jgi:hypothetical protein
MVLLPHTHTLCIPIMLFLGDAGISISGSGCSMDGIDCVTSSNYPSNYGDEQACMVTIIPTAKVKVRDFATQIEFDKVGVNGRYYSGDGSGLDGKATTQLSWSSDPDHTESGWKICFEFLALSTSEPDDPSHHDLLLEYDSYAVEEYDVEHKAIVKFYLDVECVESSTAAIGHAVRLALIAFGIANTEIISVDVVCGSAVVTAEFASDNLGDTVRAAVLTDKIVVEVNGISVIAELSPQNENLAGSGSGSGYVAPPDASSDVEGGEIEAAGLSTGGIWGIVAGAAAVIVLALLLFVKVSKKINNTAIAPEIEMIDSTTHAASPLARHADPLANNLPIIPTTPATPTPVIAETGVDSAVDSSHGALFGSQRTNQSPHPPPPAYSPDRTPFCQHVSRQTRRPCPKRTEGGGAKFCEMHLCSIPNCGKSKAPDDGYCTSCFDSLPQVHDAHHPDGGEASVDSSTDNTNNALDSGM